MKDLSGVKVVVAQKQADGKAHFSDPKAPFVLNLPGVNETRFVWESGGTIQLPAGIGAQPTSMSVPAPGTARFGIVCFAAHSFGKTDPSASAALGVPIPDDGMHQHNSLDYEIVISGKIDVILDSGEVRTLSQGDMIVMGGVYHAWRNDYDEPCIVSVVTIGARGED